MNLSIFRTQSVLQEWEFLIGLAQDEDLPSALRQEANWLVRHYPYSQKAHLSFPVPPDTSGQGCLQHEQDDDQPPDAMPPVWMTRGRKHRYIAMTDQGSRGAYWLALSSRVTPGFCERGRATDGAEASLQGWFRACSQSTTYSRPNHYSRCLRTTMFGLTRKQ